MMRHIATALLAFCVLSAAPQAQPKPDFSGIWVLDPARSDDRVYGQLRVISQTPSQIIGLTCATASCTVTEVVAGRRQQSRALPNGREASLSMHANTLIAAASE